MAAVTVTVNTISALNANQTKTISAATSTVTNGTQIMNITPTKSGGKLLIEFYGSSTKTYTYNIPASGAFFGSKAISGSVAGAIVSALEIDTARVLTTEGVIPITLTPSTGVALVAGHTAKVSATELL